MFEVCVKWGAEQM